LALSLITLAFVLLLWVGPKLKWDRFQEAIAACALVFGVLVALLACLVAHERKRRLNLPAGRGRRLKQLIEHPRAKERFPHRVIEFSARRVGRLHHAAVRKLLEGMPPGTVILARAEPAEESLPIEGVHVSFEPIRIDEPDERIADVVFPTIEQPSGEAETRANDAPNDSADEDGPKTGWLGVGRVAIVLLTTLLVLAWCVWEVIHAIIRRRPSEATLLWLVALTLAWAWLGPLFFERQWWLMPAGLAVRETGLLRRKLRVDYFRPVDSVLFLDTAEGVAHVASRGRSGTIDLPLEGPSAVLAAWFSPVDSPPREVVEAFLGSDGDKARTSPL